MVRSGPYIQAVDPAAALFQSMDAAKPTCSHRKGTDQSSYQVGDAEELWTFEKLLGGWYTYLPSGNDRWFITHNLDSHLKVNVALCLSSRYYVI